MDIAVFISPHGFGHASRCSAVMEALQRLLSGVHFHIFTTVPEWFFKQSLTAPFTYHSLTTDVGLVQDNPFFADLEATVAALDKLLPFDESLIQRLADEVNALECRLVVCDIAPIGIVVARRVGIKSVLVENFTWDWIYEIYADDIPRFKPHIEYLNQLFNSADIHIQAEPCCRIGQSHLLCPPISRKTRVTRIALRKRLAIDEAQKMVIVTMGGIQDKCRFRDLLHDRDNVRFVIPGSGAGGQTDGNIVFLPHHSEFFHPDLINAADAVIGKVGYSTLAEVYYAGVPFGYVGRPDFRESPFLCNYVKEHMPGLAIHHKDYYAGTWISTLDQLLGQKSGASNHLHGADIVADFICTQIGL